VGTIDDLIVTPGGQAPYAVLSVGGFLGLGTKYVVVSFTRPAAAASCCGYRYRHRDRPRHDCTQCFCVFNLVRPIGFRCVMRVD
jgi:hypothetical protein